MSENNKKSNWFYRQRLTPKIMDEATNSLELGLAEFFEDFYNQGIIKGELPRESVNKRLNVFIQQFAGRNKLGLQIKNNAIGNIDLTWQGDLRSGSLGSAENNADSGIPREIFLYPQPSEEQWITLGVLPTYEGILPQVDGYGITQYLQSQLTYKFRVVHGGNAPTGLAEKPSRDYFKNGILLCDVKIINGQIDIIQNDINYDRTDFISLKPISIFLQGGLSNVLTFSAFSGQKSGAAQVTDAGNFLDRFTPPGAFIERIKIIQTELKAFESDLPVSGSTTIEIAREPTFIEADKITTGLTSELNYSIDPAQLIVDLSAGESVYMRCTNAGGHYDLNWTLYYIEA